MENNNLIAINSDNKLTTTSIKIAKYFGKLHKNIVGKIKNLCISEEFNQLNFKPVEYIDTKGEKRPMYEITKDGFAFLTMGFNGKKAAKFKEDYIKAFNEMEKVLNNKLAQSTKPVSQLDFLQIMIDQFKSQEKRILQMESKMKSFENTHPKHYSLQCPKKTTKPFTRYYLNETMIRAFSVLTEGKYEVVLDYNFEYSFNKILGYNPEATNSYELSQCINKRELEALFAKYAVLFNYIAVEGIRTSKRRSKRYIKKQ